jgi:hypothetical protein
MSRTTSFLGSLSVRSLSIMSRLIDQLTPALWPDNLPEVTKIIKPILGDYYNYDTTVSGVFKIPNGGGFNENFHFNSPLYMLSGDLLRNVRSLRAKAMCYSSRTSMERLWYTQRTHLATAPKLHKIPEPTRIDITHVPCRR